MCAVGSERLKSREMESPYQDERRDVREIHREVFSQVVWIQVVVLWTA
jgi:hypothetical protein